VNNHLSKREEEGLIRGLDRAEVLAATVAQLRKDLAVGADDLQEPPVGTEAFERLRTEVLALLERWERAEPLALSRAVNRVDLTERTVDRAMDLGGLHQLAGFMVLRCLQKVLLRKHFASRG
jgi:hypothetical protein